MNYGLLLDIQSLDIVIKRLMSEIADEKKRLTYLNDQKSKKIDVKINLEKKLSELKKALSELEKNNFELNKKLKSNQNALNEVTTNTQMLSLEKQIESQKNENQVQENQMFSLLEEIENLEIEIKDSNGFIEGVTQTIQEASSEIQEIIDPKEKEIINLERQIDALCEEIQPDIRNVYLKIRDKYRFDLPVVKLGLNSCGKCRFIFSRQDIHDIEEKRDYKICGSCGRINISPDIH